jgi:hypothetical protein
MARTVLRTMRMKNSYRISIRKPERNVHRGHRWKNNIEMDLKETGCEGLNSIYLPDDWFL